MNNNLNKYRNFSKLSDETIRNRIKAAPDICPITGLKKIESYAFDEGVVYGYDMPHDAYTLPEYDRDDLSFYRWKIDMDNDYTREYEFVCALSELEDRDDYEEIKKMYGIE